VRKIEEEKAKKRGEKLTKMQTCRRRKASGDSATIMWSRMCLATLCGLLLLGIQIEQTASAPAGEDAAATTMPPLDATTDAPDGAAATTTPATPATPSTPSTSTIGVEQSSNISSITAEAADGSTTSTSTTTTTEAANKSNADETGESQKPKSQPKAMKIIDAA